MVVVRKRLVAFAVVFPVAVMGMVIVRCPAETGRRVLMAQRVLGGMNDAEGHLDGKEETEDEADQPRARPAEYPAQTALPLMAEARDCSGLPGE